MSDFEITEHPRVINVPLLIKTLEYIETHQYEWDQGSWYGPMDEGLFDISHAILTPTGELQWDASDTTGVQNICGTAFCFAGHAANLSGAKWYIEKNSTNVWVQCEPKDCWLNQGLNYRDDHVATIHKGRPCHMDISIFAEKELGLDEEQAERLFNGMNDLDDLKLIVADYIAEAEK